ncbi:uncharacterized protein METZ01_LOCUS367773, partial [marine metagenome]
VSSVVDYFQKQRTNLPLLHVWCGSPQ